MRESLASMMSCGVRERVLVMPHNGALHQPATPPARVMSCVLAGVTRSPPQHLRFAQRCQALCAQLESQPLETELAKS